MRCLLFGNGYWANILKKYLAVNGFDVVGIIDHNTDEISFQKYLKEVEAAFICTPVDTHYQYVVLSLKHGLNVFCEKILTRDAISTRELYALARRRGKTLFTDYTYMFSESINLIKKKITCIGPIKRINAEIAQYGKFYPNATAVETIGVHMLSAIHYIMSDYSLIHFTEYGETNDSILIGVAGSISVYIRSSLYSNVKRRFIEFIGTNGIITANMMGNENVVEQYFNGKKTTYSFDEGNNLGRAVREFNESINMHNSINEQISIAVVQDVEAINYDVDSQKKYSIHE